MRTDPPDRAPSTTASPGARLVARGAAENPASRFDRIHVEDDAELAEEQDGDRPPLSTLYLRDPSRSVLSHNQSPDIGFDTSLNPYRGCEHGCSYCLVPDTPVLFADMRWRRLGDVQVGDELVGIEERPEPGRARKIRRATVENVWWSRKPTLRLLTRHEEVVTTAEHRWLQFRHFRWTRTDRLEPGRLLRRMPVPEDEGFDDDYRIGYVASMTLGDATFRYQPGWRSDKRGFPQSRWRVALVDREPLVRLRDFLATLGVSVEIRPCSAGGSMETPMWKVETRALGRLAILHQLMAKEPQSRSYRRGFLAGFSDAEGQNGTSSWISQKDVSVLERVRRYARSLGFGMCLEPRGGHASTLRLVGPFTERIRFFRVCRPAIERKRDLIFDHQLAHEPEPIEAIERYPVRDVVDIQTSTGTFYAAGIATHNCYARPTHEYFGFSAGLDFETRVMVKPDAPALLRRALASPRWKPQVVAMSGVTDPYQPVERRLRITRGCLEVFAEFRNPVAVVTKGAGVVRDADLLAELARHGAAAVKISVTTLDDGLRRRLEPRAASPRQRLRAIAALAKAGVPVGVMVAPIIPGLNDSEIPSILRAAAEAGASTASAVMLRLPHGVAPLFESWLERHLPERKDRVMGRVREMREGRLDDPRFHTRMRGSGAYARQVLELFEVARRRAGIAESAPPLRADAFRRPASPQLELF